MFVRTLVVSRHASRPVNPASVAAYEADAAALEKARASRQANAAKHGSLALRKGKGLQPAVEQQEAVQLKAVPNTAASAPLPADTKDGVTSSPGVASTTQGLPQQDGGWC